MSALHHTLEAPLVVDVAADVAPVEPRRRHRDPARSAVKTTPGGLDRHVHCVIFDAKTGRGVTSPGPDGHVHPVTNLEIKRTFGHGHDLSATRCMERHNEEAGWRHVQSPKR